MLDKGFKDDVTLCSLVSMLFSGQEDNPTRAGFTQSQI